ncbi:invasion associated locus B family protein [Commensalibacter nepenthis]|uniref:Invasion associated locus B family protein n=1 Tax=Commensalibacter nepenthis TaxID=3043872 RepID=A0ABT6Q4F2_9PROT|nr:invasion associated locus B family protein [Commensalibacter sp. TBRC 10068]MDI2111776.1 invasion associated locus B family protein [Commensalibacter sp. TBRC 10068]
MRNLLLSSAILCAFAVNITPLFAQDKTNQPTTHSNNTAAPAPITINQQVGSWQLHCAYPNKEEQKQQKTTSQGCIAQQSLMIKGKDNTQTPIASLLLEKVKDNQNPTKANPFRLTIVTPLGFSLQQPITLAIDHGNQTQLPWVTCTTNGCIASEMIDNKLQTSLEANKMAHLIIHRVNKTTVTINFNIEDLHTVLTSMNDLINKKAP